MKIIGVIWQIWHRSSLKISTIEMAAKMAWHQRRRYENEAA
jgi:hypothetical protein